MGSKLGQLLKVDACTSSTTRGRYARICIEVPLEKLLKTRLLIGHHNQLLLYEGLNLLCTMFGPFGHANFNCYFISQQPPEQNTSNHYSISSNTDTAQEPKWKTVNFPRKSLQRYNTNRPPVLNRAVREATKVGQQTNTGKYPISIGPSGAHQLLNKSTYTNKSSNKYVELIDLDNHMHNNMDFDNSYSTSPIRDIPIINNSTDPEKDKLIEHYPLEIEPQPISPNHKSITSSSNNPSFPAHLLSATNQSTPNTTHTPSKEPTTAYNHLENTSQSSIHKPTYLHDTTTPSGIHVDSSNVNLHATVTYVQSSPPHFPYKQNHYPPCDIHQQNSTKMKEVYSDSRIPILNSPASTTSSYNLNTLRSPSTENTYAAINFPSKFQPKLHMKSRQ